jgi:hypothetical protein
MPWLNGEDLTRRRLLDRKARLRDAISGADPRIRFTDHVVANGADVLAQTDALDLEGIVSKRRDEARDVPPANDDEGRATRHAEVGERGARRRAMATASRVCRE